MWLHEQLERESVVKEQQYLESIGPIGRAFDNHAYFCVTMFTVMNVGMFVGFLIGMML